jgi:hypothetical protein
MKRAVITGMGLVSPLGNNKAETLDSLKATRSGIKFQEAYKEMGLRSHVAGSIELDTEALIDRKLRRFMGDASAFAYVENNPIMFIDPTGMFKDWYQNEEGQFLWAKKSEDAIDFNGKTYKNLNKGSNELPDDLKSDDGANLVVAGQNSDAFSTENDDWQSHADNVAKSGNNGKTNVLALVNNSDELIEAFEHTSSQFGFIESAFIRSHAFGGTGFNDFGLNLGSTSQDNFGYNSIIKFNSKLKQGDNEKKELTSKIEKLESEKIKLIKFYNFLSLCLVYMFIQ